LSIIKNKDIMTINKKINGITFNEVQWNSNTKRYFKIYLNDSEIMIQHEYKNIKGFLNAIKREENK